ncbi:MAG: GTPase HflX [Clostridiales bacterium]|nr:GTPase HflX [Clostridiales bacterium]
MLKFNENNEVVGSEAYRAILVGRQGAEDVAFSMEELSGLAEAAGAEVLGQMVQNLEKPVRATLIGKGKVAELAEMIQNMDADTVIFNDELSGVQLRNLEDQLGAKVIDRTILILDIFAARAVSGEGKLQVEFAQLQYRLPRLTGFGKSLSRLGGGIGTRGPGEKKLETDRRHVKKRMDDIKAEIKKIKSSRDVQRSKREKSEIPVVALVGYTNSGKSAVMNKLLEITDKTDKSVFVEDMLFATLDTAQRSIKLDNNNEFILIDTVGFVSKLPHSLINAFKATLEEVTYADLLLHIVDVSYENHDFHIEVTEQVLKEIGAGDKKKLTVFNKTDLLPPEMGGAAGDGAFKASPASVGVSAKTGYGMEGLLERIKGELFSDRVTAAFLIPYDKGSVSSYICEKAEVYSMDYTEEGVLLSACVANADYSRLRQYEQIQDCGK